MEIFDRFVLVVLCLLLASCGFQLRGQVDLPTGVEPVYIGGISTNQPLAIELRNLLTSSGVALTPDGTHANYQLIIGEQEQDRRTLSLGEGARAAEYQLLETVVFELRNNRGKTVLGPNRLTERRTIPNDPDRAVSSAEEEKLLRREMLKKLAAKIALQLQSYDYDQEAAASVTP